MRTLISRILYLNCYFGWKALCELNTYILVDLPPKRRPEGAAILHWPWCMPVGCGLVISMLTSAHSRGLRAATATLSGEPNRSPATNLRQQPSGHASSPSNQTPGNTVHNTGWNHDCMPGHAMSHANIHSKYIVHLL